MKKKEILPMKEVEWLVLHCSATRCNKSFTFEDLKRCHRAKGYAYDCGYHWYITPTPAPRPRKPPSSSC